MYRRILVPFDGSPTSNCGLDEAIALAKLTGARLRLVYLVDDLVFATGFETGAVSAIVGMAFSLKLVMHIPRTNEAGAIRQAG